MKVWYLPLEPYRERYTELLCLWVVNQMTDAGCEVEVVGTSPEADVGSIAAGVVLDAHRRCRWSLAQTFALVGKLPLIAPDDIVLFEDMFTPGLEALPYALSVTRGADREQWPRIYARCYAQSVDPDDFTHPMRSWMRPLEQMVFDVCDGIFVASDCHADMLAAAGLDAAPVHAVGLPFDADGVRGLLGGIAPTWADKAREVVYASRLDEEKQPFVLIEVARRLAKHEVPTTILTGAEGLRSNNRDLLELVNSAVEDGTLRLRAGLTKRDYYRHLAAARVQFNCARQDFVSFTMLDASAVGTATVAPAFRSFPEELPARQLYQAFDPDAAVARILEVMDGSSGQWYGKQAEDHSSTVGRMVEVMQQDAREG